MMRDIARISTITKPERPLLPYMCGQCVSCQRKCRCFSVDGIVLVSLVTLSMITKYSSGSNVRVEVILDSDILQDVITGCLLDGNTVSADK